MAAVAASASVEDARLVSASTNTNAVGSSPLVGLSVIGAALPNPTASSGTANANASGASDADANVAARVASDAKADAKTDAASASSSSSASLNSSSAAPSGSADTNANTNASVGAASAVTGVAAVVAPASTASTATTTELFSSVSALKTGAVIASGVGGATSLISNKVYGPNRVITEEERARNASGGFYDEVEIEDMEFDAAKQTYFFPCPCGDRFAITVNDLKDGEEIARCPSCSLKLRVIYDPEDFEDPVSDPDDD